MSKQKLLEPFPWEVYSKKLRAKIERPHSVGEFSPKEAAERGLRFAYGSDGQKEEGNIVALFFLVDPQDGVIVDAKFQVFGQTALIGAAEAVCMLSVGKNYDEAHRLSADQVDEALRDEGQKKAFPFETYGHLNLVLGALDQAMLSCEDIPLPESYVAPFASSITGDGYPGFEDLPLKKKLAVVEQVINDEVRPFIEMDAGGVEVLNILHGKEVVIAYQGACTSCFSATGATLSTIQQILRAKVHPEIMVTPDLDGLNF